MRFFADTVSWNRTAAELGEAVGMGDYVRRFHLGAYGRTPSAQGKMQPKIAAYSVAIVDAAEAVDAAGKRTTVRVAQTTYGQSIRSGLGNVAIGTAIPWNPKWALQLPEGSDRCLVIIDDRTGETWELWQTAAPHVECIDWPVLPWLPINTFRWLGGPNAKAGFVVGDPGWIGAGTCFHTTDIFTTTETVDGRGMGINKAALTVTLDELEAGEIRHALAAVMGNPMAGPLAAAPSTNLDPAAGTTKVFYLPPARKAEYANRPDGSKRPVAPANQFPISDANPTGIRYALRITDAQIDAWLDRRGYVGPTRAFVRMIAVALRDYGWIYAETGEWGVGLEFQAATTTGAADRYRALGAPIGAGTPTGTPLGDLLDGLIESGTVYVVKAV